MPTTPSPSSSLNLAPDGAPRSDIQMSQQHSTLISVVLVSDPTRHLMIAKQNFDPKVHRKVDAPPAKKSQPRIRPVMGTESEAELLTFTVKRLQGLPEYPFITSPSTTKADLVKQILAIRNPS